MQLGPLRWSQRQAFFAGAPGIRHDGVIAPRPGRPGECVRSTIPLEADSTRLPKGPVDHRSPIRRQPLWTALAIGVPLACSGRDPADPGFSPTEGVLVAKPGGGYFLADPHRGGKETRLRLLDAGWGRLVDVHDVDEQGQASPIPVLRDVVIGESVRSDGTGLGLETNAVTHESRLIVRRPRNAPDSGAGTFASILDGATRSLSGFASKHDDGSASPPFSLVARDATLVLRFSDLLEDGPEARETLLEAVRLTVGYPPVTPMSARIVFDPSHGGIAEGVFHSTRVLVDFTVSEREALDLPGGVPINAAGLPASSQLTTQANASLHLPTRIEASIGRFVRLTNLAGRGLELAGPVESATQDLVRAFRAGNSGDANAGYLLDLQQPSIVGTWEIAIVDARDDPLAPQGYGFVVELVFQTPCRAAPRQGDTLELAGEFYEVRAPGSAPDLDGRVRNVRLLRLETEALASANALLGLARFLTLHRLDDSLQAACWVSFAPQPLRPPSEEIASDTRIRLRFSEPMDPDTFRAFDTFRVLRGRADIGEILADDLVVGSVRVEQDLQEFTFVPRLPFDNQGGPEYRFELREGPLGVRDLSGNALTSSFGHALFLLSAAQPPYANHGFALRFESRDELQPPGLNDVRGQVSYDAQGGVLRPRPPVFASFSADRGNSIPNLMQTWPFGVQTPLSPMGSKLQAIWRHCDLGFRVRDEAFHNLDVVGLSWSPLGGRASADFFPLFELRLAHALHVPDESSTSNGPKYPESGLLGRPHEFTLNLLNDPRSPQAAVHPRGLGYVVLPSDLTLSGRGTPLMPFPWNRAGAPLTSFTWRDTSVLAKGGLRSPGVPLDIEVGQPSGFDVGQGEVGLAGEVPSIGLPLLWEVRCYPTTRGLGLNSFDILLPIPGWAVPNFRAFSTGGVDQNGQTVLVDPDLELRPNGGFNPNSRPPGRPTPLTADNSFYVGSIDTVVRVSRATTIWIDSGNFAPRYVEPVIEPRSQIGATRLELEYRGAEAFSEDAGNAPFDAAQLDPYGDFETGTVTFHGDGTWSDDIHSADGARFLQVRFSFVNDILAGLSPELDSFGLAFEVD